MVFPLGKKYQHYVCPNGCMCGNPEDWAGAFSRRNSLLGGAAAVATPMVLAANAAPSP